MPEVGVEPTCPRGAGDFESPASTSFTTPAHVKGISAGARICQGKNVIDNFSLRVLNAHLHWVCGAVAQLGERLNGIQEVTGSIPVSSTKNISEGCRFELWIATSFCLVMYSGIIPGYRVP